MSITIDDMKMPKSCTACPFEHNGDCYGGKPKRIMDIEDFEYYRHPCCPLIEAEPTKHGRWIHHQYGNTEGYYECDNCGKLNSYESSYCPKCGARMDGKEK